MGLFRAACVGVAAVCTLLALVTFAITFPNPLKAFTIPSTTPMTALSRSFHPITIPSPGPGPGPGLAGWYIPSDTALRTGTEPRMLLVLHGRSRSKEWALGALTSVVGKYGIVMFDFPGHGRGGSFGVTTVGLTESAAVDAALDWIQEHHVGASVVVYGTSMGGAAAVFALARNPRYGTVLGLLTDGTFARLSDVAVGLGGRLGLGPRVVHTLLAAVDAIVRTVVWDGVSIYDVDPVDAVPRLDMPALFMHGESDNLVLPHAAEDLAAAAPHGKAYFYEGGHDEPTNPHVRKAVSTLAGMLVLLQSTAA